MLSDLTADLRGLGGQRVWSLMISLFGDLAQNEGDAIEGPVLSEIMGHMAVKPEAARVALHRLRNDGWIASAKSGRIRQHSLTAEGRRQSALASPRIYARPPVGGEAWQVVLTAETTGGIAGYSALMPRVYLGPAAMPAPKGALVLEGGAVPDWVRDQLTPHHLTEDYAHLLNTLKSLSTALSANAALTPMQVAVLRCLIVHNWRRLVLKHPMLPLELIDTRWPGYQCHLQVDSLLGRFARPALGDISLD